MCVANRAIRSEFYRAIRSEFHCNCSIDFAPQNAIISLTRCFHHKDALESEDDGPNTFIDTTRRHRDPQEESDDDLTDPSPEKPRKHHRRPGSSHSRKESGQSRDSSYDQENRQPVTNHGFRTKEQIFRERAAAERMAATRKGAKASKAIKKPTKEPTKGRQSKRRQEQPPAPPDESESETETILEVRQEELLRQLADLKRENNDLKKAQKTSLPAPVSNKRRKFALGADLIPVGTELNAKVGEFVKFETWRKTKFLSTEDELLGACEVIMEEIEEFQHLIQETDDKDGILKAFSSVYGKLITKELNTRRTNVASALKKAYDKRAKTGAQMPTLKELQKVVSRARDLLYLEVPQGSTKAQTQKIKADCAKNNILRDFFDWYWDSLLPCIQGKYSWGHGMRYYHTISGGHFPGEEAKKYVTSSDEALVLLMYENYRKRWPYTFKCSQNNKEPDTKSNKYKVEWSDNTSGNSQWGGWDPKGRAKFKELAETIAKCRQKQYNGSLEKQALKRLRQAKNLDDSAKAKKTVDSDTDGNVVPTECAMLDWNSDDESAAADDFVLGDLEEEEVESEDEEEKTAEEATKNSGEGNKNTGKKGETSANDDQEPEE